MNRRDFVRVAPAAAAVATIGGLPRGLTEADLPIAAKQEIISLDKKRAAILDRVQEIRIVERVVALHDGFEIVLDTRWADCGIAVQKAQGEFRDATPILRDLAREGLRQRRDFAKLDYVDRWEWYPGEWTELWISYGWKKDAPETIEDEETGEQRAPDPDDLICEYVQVGVQEVPVNELRCRPKTAAEKAAEREALIEEDEVSF